MVTIALITDDKTLQREWRGHLVEWGYRSWILESDESFIDQLKERGAELLLIDFSSDSYDAVSMLRIIKKDGDLREIPAIALCRKEELFGIDLSCGIEDFLVKDAPAEVLNARLRLAMWRHSKVDSEDTIKVGSLMMNLASYQVTVDGQMVDLTYKEYELLRFLITRRGRVFSREALLRHVWGEEYFGGTRTVDVHIRRLRAKIGLPFQDLIETVRNVGYRFRADSRW